MNPIEAILEAVSDEFKYRTIGQIRRYLNVGRNVDFFPEINHLIEEKKIEKHDTPDFAYYLPYGLRPVRAWLADGGVEVEYDDRPAPKKTDPFQAPAATTSTRNSKLDDFTTEDIEELAAGGATRAEIATKIGLTSVTNLTSTLKRRPGMFEAYQRGRRVIDSQRARPPRKAKPEPDNIVAGTNSVDPDKLIFVNDVSAIPPDQHQLGADPDDPKAFVSKPTEFTHNGFWAYFDQMSNEDGTFTTTAEWLADIAMLIVADVQLQAPPRDDIATVEHLPYNVARACMSLLTASYPSDVINYAIEALEREKARIRRMQDDAEARRVQ